MAESTESPLVSNHFYSVNNLHCINMSKNRPLYEYTHFCAHLPFDIRGIGLLDSGSSHSLIPSSLLPQAIIDKLGNSTETFTGISGTGTKAIGSFTTDLNICGVFLQNITFHVMPVSCPLLLGQNILRHKSILRYEINHVTRTLRLYRDSGVADGELCSGPCIIKTPPLQ